jgi:hypothetical protein
MTEIKFFTSLFVNATLLCGKGTSNDTMLLSSFHEILTGYSPESLCTFPENEPNDD